jgi:hypothetical protein
MLIRSSIKKHLFMEHILYQDKYTRSDKREVFLTIFNRIGVIHIQIANIKDGKPLINDILLEVLADPAPLDTLVMTAQMEANLIKF